MFNAPRDALLKRHAVSVVIPTTGRSTLVRSVQSALSQQGVEIEVIVVADDRSPDTASTVLGQVLTHPRTRLLTTGGRAGAATARAIGTEAATNAWVAYLDDDDVWHPNKLAVQLDAAGGHPGDLIVSCRTESVTSHAKRVIVPREPYRDGDIASYLFRRRRLRADRNLIHTSTLLCPRHLALEVGWERGLQRHQDWDFLLRCTERPHVQLRQIEAVLVEAHAGTPHSVSASSDWSASLAWARTAGRTWPPATYVDFMVGQPLRYALRARSLVGVRCVLSECRGRGRPSLRACILGLSGLLPRPLAVRVMHR